MDVDTGITSEVFTIKSETKLIDIFNNIINKKSEACLNYIDSLNLDKNTKIVVVGTYFTGVGIVKKLRKKYNNILLIDIYPHLKELLDTDIGGDYKKSIEFSTSLELINSGDVVIDTTGFGGLTVEQSSEINAEVFLIEDPVAEDNDRLLKDKRVSMKTKLVISGAVAYITIPSDLIPDKVPFVGKIDDIAIGIFALNVIMTDVPLNIIMENWQGKNDILVVVKNVIEYATNFTGAKNIDSIYRVMEEILSV